MRGWREAQTLASERDKLREQITGLEAEASNLKKEITSLNSLLETFRRRVSELETIASPLVNGTWREITRFERSGRGWTQISNNRFPNAYVDTVTIPESLAIRLKITRLSGGQAVFWRLNKPRDNDNYYSTVIAKDNAVDVISLLSSVLQQGVKRCFYTTRSPEITISSPILRQASGMKW